MLFIETVLDDLESKLCLDLSHIHATGISAGGLFSYQVGQSLSEIFASVMPVEGSILIGFNDVEPEYPISLLDFRCVLLRLILFVYAVCFVQGHCGYGDACECEQ